MPYSHPLTYDTSSALVDAAGNNFYTVTAPTFEKVQMHPSVATWRPRRSKPRYVWVPFGRDFHTYDTGLMSMLLDPTQHSTITGQNVPNLFEAADFDQNSAMATNVANGAVHYGSHPGSSDFWSSNCGILARKEDRDLYHLESVLPNANTHMRVNWTGVLDSGASSVLPWSDFKPTATTPTIIDPNTVTVNFIDRMCHYHLASPPTPLPPVYEWYSLDQLMAEAVPLGQTGLLTHPIFATTGTYQFCMIRIDTVLGTVAMQNFGSEPDILLENQTEAPDCLVPSGLVTMAEYGDNYYRVSLVQEYAIQKESSWANYPGSHLFDPWTATDSVSGSMRFKGVFPSTQGPEVCRYVNFTTPRLLPSGGPPIAPLATHSGYSYTVSERDGIRRFTWDNDVSTGHSLNLLISDKIFFELAEGGQYTLDARRLRLPTPLIQNVLTFDKPWNQEAVTFGMCHDDHDIAFKTKDQMDWELDINGRDGKVTGTFLSSTNPNSELRMFVELGMLCRRTSGAVGGLNVVLRGELPYVSWERGSYS